jgi:hypothetical protein
MLTESEAVPETETVPETEEPLVGEVMATEGEGEAMLMEKFLEAVAEEASLTCTEKEKEPAREGVPEKTPPELSESPLGSEPLVRLQM